MRHTGAKAKREAVVVASEELDDRRRLSCLAEELGSFEGFPSAEELHALLAWDSRSGRVAGAVPAVPPGCRSIRPGPTLSLASKPRSRAVAPARRDR